ncbi:MAG TPA: molybdopterin converting factor, partial [Erythrobacter sp.]|nr:molybdopterin converting factor [Erythrobacter sp.]HBQ53049.1 molybdopterin converting factor [Erythrobacter sp.]
MARLVLQTPLDVRVLEKGLSVGEALAAFNAA